MPDALMVTSSFLPGHGGIESYLAELCSSLAPRVAVLAPPSRDGNPLPRDLPYPTIPGPNSMLWPGREVERAVLREAERLGTQKVLFGTPWPLALLGPRLRAAGLRYAAIIHGAELLVPGAVPLLRKKLARSLAQADLLLPVSDYTASATERLLDANGLAVPEISLLRARVDLDRFRPDLDGSGIRARLGIDPDAKIILTFGRLVERKGVHRMIAAMPEISRAVPDAIYVVGGTGPEERKLRRLAERTQARVVFAGRVPDEDAPALYATGGVFALPVVDRWFGLEIEGLGVVLLEAAACETPCVTGTSGGTPEAVIDGETGYVIDAKVGSQLIERTVALLTDEEGAARMGAAGRRHVAAHFSTGNEPETLLRWLT